MGSKENFKKKKKGGTHTLQDLEVSINKLCSKNTWLLMVLRGVTSIAYVSLSCFNSLRIEGEKNEYLSLALQQKCGVLYFF